MVVAIDVDMPLDNISKSPIWFLVESLILSKKKMRCDSAGINQLHRVSDNKNIISKPVGKKH